ncbi:MAG: LPS export ABC transporter ATP-binding protein [Chlamydiae bacterium]|nr:LPS export ABC transporter ATP-binding protein [Chlamydiota bacterium]
MLLETKNISKSFGGRTVLSDLSFSINKAEIIGLLGPNGAGKTTAFYITMGVIRPDSGHVFFKGHDITRLPIHKRASLGLGYLAQEPSVFYNLSVVDNLKLVLEAENLPKNEQNHRLEGLLEELRLTHLAKKLAGSLSGGERRRLEITRALITSPECLLLDEPFANIDPLSIHEVQELLLHLKQRGISVLITDHNAREIFVIADSSFLINDGRVIFSGTKEELLSSEEARQHYLGHNFKL